jgi:glycosyltransferase involved in cell wall biosynthesis
LRIYTCTPVDFSGDEGFFARDSGLLCRGFQKIGIESKTVMPGNLRGNDCHDLMRAPYFLLQSTNWWKSQKIDAVVFYSWGAPRFWRIARAIKKANIKLLINLDSGGYYSILQNPVFLARFFFLQAINKYGFLKGFLLAIFRMLRDLFLPYHELFRLLHMHQADYLLAVSPLALDRVRLFLGIFYQHNLALRLRFIPHPVSDSALYRGKPKQNLVVALGRWTATDWQKNPELHIHLLSLFLEKHIDFKAVITGPFDHTFEALLTPLRPDIRSRLVLTGRIPNEQVLKILEEAKISIALTRHESFHIATGEALCCGCSIVTYPSLMLPSMEYFMGNGDGTMAKSCRPADILQALDIEADRWDKGHRDPFLISAFWQKRLHASNVALSIAAL